MIESLKARVLSDLNKICIDNVRDYDWFEASEPWIFCSDGRTIFYKDNCYHIVAKDHGRLVSELTTSDRQEARYEILDSYVFNLACRVAAFKDGSDGLSYREHLFIESGRLFALIDEDLAAKNHEENQKPLNTEVDLMAERNNK